METPLFTFEKFKEEVIKSLKENYYIEDPERVDKHDSTGEFDKDLREEYDSELQKFLAGKITERQFREGMVLRVAYCQYMLS